MAEMTMPASALNAGADPAVGDAPDAPTVLCTVMLNADGTFSLTRGDAVDVPAEGALEGAGAGDTMGAGEAADENFASVGELLKAVMDVAKSAQTNGDGTDEENFNAGYTGGIDASPARPGAGGLAQKY